MNSSELSHAALIRAGDIWLDRYQELERARSVFERVFTANPKHAAAFGRLAKLLSATQEWDRLVRTYRRRMEQLEGASRGALQLELAAIYRDNLREVATAIDVLNALLEHDPKHRQALTEIAELCLAQERWRKRRATSTDWRR